MATYIPRIRTAIRLRIDWSMMASKKGNTQERERYYIGLTEEIITEMGGAFNSASSQSSVDIQDISFPDETPFHLEGKATTRHDFMLNDTMIKPDVYYLLLYTKHRIVDIELGADIITGATDNGPHNIVEGRAPMTTEQIFKGFEYFMDEAVYSVRCGVMSMFDFGQMWKQTWKFNKITSRPRPNWKITIPRKPSESSEEEPHSQSE